MREAWMKDIMAAIEEAEASYDDYDYDFDEDDENN